MPFPATTVRVTSIEPAGETKVRIMMEMLVDVHRLSEVGGEMLRAAMVNVKAAKKKK